MAFRAAQFAGVSTTPVLIATGIGATVVRIQADGLIAIGPDNTVTSSTGFTTQATDFPLQDGDEIWAVKAQTPAVGINVFTTN